MISGAITAAIAGILSAMGIPPAKYVAPIFIAVKIITVLLIFLLGSKFSKWREKRRAQAEVGGDTTS